MNIFFLVVLALAFGWEPEPLGDPAQVPIRLVAVISGSLFIMALARWISVWTIGRLRRDFSNRARILSRFHWLSRLHGLLSVVAFGVLIERVGWNSVVCLEWGLQNWFVIEELLILAPFLIQEAVSFALLYDVDQEIRRQMIAAGQPVRATWTRGQYVNFQFRSQFGIWLLVSLWISGLRDIGLWLFPGWKNDQNLFIAGVALTSLSVLVLTPLMIRIAWQARPLPKGAKRQQLEELAQRLGFRYSDILVWHTSGGIANAAVTGLIPQLRYVLLSDALLDNSTPEELGAVFGHEVGHIRHHHMTYYFGFVLASVLFVGLLTSLLITLAQRTVSPGVWELVESVSAYVPLDLELFLLLPYIGVVFGFLSRRFERQADLFGTRAASHALAFQPQASSPIETAMAAPAGGNGQAAFYLSSTDDDGAPTEGRGEEASNQRPHFPVEPAGVAVFIRSLEKVALMNGIARAGWSWRHGSIAHRIDFLEQVERDPKLADRFDQSVRALRWLVAGSLALGILGLYAVLQVL